MVRTLTAHRVFPAKVTGGNGIAGTSVVPVSLKRIRPWLRGLQRHSFVHQIVGLALGLDDGMMVGPGLFETVRHQFDGGRALAVP
jgi:hypothetical protein